MPKTKDKKSSAIPVVVPLILLILASMWVLGLSVGPIAGACNTAYTALSEDPVHPTPTACVELHYKWHTKFSNEEEVTSTLVHCDQGDYLHIENNAAVSFDVGVPNGFQPIDWGTNVKECSTKPPGSFLGAYTYNLHIPAKSDWYYPVQLSEEYKKYLGGLE